MVVVVEEEWKLVLEQREVFAFDKEWVDQYRAEAAKVAAADREWRERQELNARKADGWMSNLTRIRLELQRRRRNNLQVPLPQHLNKTVIKPPTCAGAARKPVRRLALKPRKRVVPEPIYVLDSDEEAEQSPCLREVAPLCA